MTTGYTIIEGWGGIKPEQGDGRIGDGGTVF